MKTKWFPSIAKEVGYSRSPAKKEAASKNLEKAREVLRVKREILRELKVTP